MQGGVVKRQLVLSSQRAKVFEISRRFSSHSHASQPDSKVDSVPFSASNKITEADFEVLFIGLHSV